MEYTVNDLVFWELNELTRKYPEFVFIACKHDMTVGQLIDSQRGR
jgi:hypothetical protein